MPVSAQFMLQTFHQAVAMKKSKKYSLQVRQKSMPGHFLQFTCNRNQLQVQWLKRVLVKNQVQLVQAANHNLKLIHQFQVRFKAAHQSVQLHQQANNHQLWNHQAASKHLHQVKKLLQCTLQAFKVHQVQLALQRRAQSILQVLQLQVQWARLLA